MKRLEFAKVVKYCEAVIFEYPEFSILAGDLADLLHQKSPYTVQSDMRHVAALTKWQAMQLNIEWDIQALNEVFEWMRYRVLIVDLDAAMESIKERGTKPVKTKKIEGFPECSDPRFSNVEVG